MRLWSIHPKYLDTRGLVALWREALLAQQVLRGETRGYQNHPQLERYRAHSQPERAIGAYLRELLSVREVEPHPIFEVIEGKIEDWEKMASA